MNQKRSRNEIELEQELELLIKTRTIDNLMKKIQKTSGRKKIQPTIKELEKELQDFNVLFDEYKANIFNDTE